MPEKSSKTSQIEQSNSNYLPNIRALLGFSWEIEKERFKTFAAIIILPFFILLLGLIFTAIGILTKQTLITITSLGISVITFLFFSLSSSIAMILTIKFRDEKIGFRQAYSRSLVKVIPYFVMSLILVLITTLGYLLFIIPGLLFSIWFSLAGYVLMCEDVGPIEALKRSRAYTKGKYFAILYRLSGLGLVILLINIVFTIIPVVNILSFVVVPLIATPLSAGFNFGLYENLKNLNGKEISNQPGKFFVYSLVFLLVIFLLCIFVFFAFVIPNLVKNYQNKANTVNNSITKTDSDVGWKTYENNEIGIAFDYPSNWGPIEKDEELCLSSEGSTRLINGKTCVGIYLSNSLKNGYFFSAQSKKFPDNNPGRGAGFGDMYTITYKNTKIAPKEFIDTLCSKRKYYSCELKNNNYNFTYVKVLNDEQVIQSERKAHYYYVLNGNDNFPILILSNQSLLDSMSLKEAEAILDKIISSLRVTEIVPYTTATATQTPTPTSSQKNCTVDWSNLPSVINANQTYYVPVTFTSNFGTRLPSIYIAPGGGALYRANNSAFNQNSVTVTLNINIADSGNYLLNPYLDDESGKGIKCNGKDVNVSP